MSKIQKTRSTPKFVIPAKHRDMPATLGFIDEVRSELKADIRALDHKLSAQINEVKAQVEQVLSAVHRTQTLMEEQRHDNRAVLDGLKIVNGRQDRVEENVKDMKDTLTLLAKRKPPLSQ